MRLIDLLVRAGGLPAAKLLEVLQWVIVNAPDLADEARQIMDKLNAAVPLENLLSVAAILPTEIANIAAGKIDPRDHPSDAA